MFISNAYAQTAAASAGGMETLYSFFPIILMFVILYFLMLRPQMKRQKEHKAMVEAITKGDEVITAGGILGTVVKVSEVYVTIAVAGNTEILVQRTAISTLLPKGTIKTL